MLAKGCTDVLTKPYDFDDLFSLVRTHLSGGKAAEELIRLCAAACLVPKASDA